jgi:tripartite-type tricarboxylate transporter receptor subunit TctC
MQEITARPLAQAKTTMTRSTSRRGLVLGFALGTMMAPFIARRGRAEAFPSRPVRIVIGFPPGGGIDILARLIAPKMSERLGQPVVIDNRPGANAQIATQIVAQAEPDGHTILFGTTGNLAVNQSLYADRPGTNMERDFVALSQVASLGFVLVVGPTMPAKSFAELIDYAKSHPAQVLFGSSGTGGLPHLCGELLNLQAAIRTVHVPYRGSAPAFTDLISGQLHYIFDAAAIALPHIQAGSIRALAVTGPTPIAALPGVPLAKQTLPDFEVVNWYGMVVRKGTPAAFVTRLQQEVAFALRDAEVVERAGALGLDLLGTTPEQFGAFQRAEIAKWAKVIKSANIHVD